LFDLGAMPLSLALLVLSFGAWACSLALSSLVESAGVDGLFRWGLLCATAVMAVLAGMVLTTGFAHIADPLFTPVLAPAKVGAVGAVCRVRTPPSRERDRPGDAVVLTGAMERSIISIRSHTEPAPQRGDVLLIVSYDAGTESFLVAPADEAIHP
jgi:hypothetical protein